MVDESAVIGGEEMRWIKFIFKLIGRGIPYLFILWCWAVLCSAVGSLTTTSFFNIMGEGGEGIIGIGLIIFFITVAYHGIGFIEWAMKSPLLEKKR